MFLPSPQAASDDVWVAGQMHKHAATLGDAPGQGNRSRQGEA